MIADALKHMEAALKGLSDLDDALDKSLIVAITDQRGIITFANEKFCEISKYSREELLGQNHRIINSGYHSKAFFKDMWRTIANGRTWRGDIRNRAKDGTLYWMDTTIVPSLNEKGKPYQYISFRIDITERKKTEEFLRRSDKIAAVGQLASGIAHEIRNPLAAIKMSIQSLESADQQNTKMHEMILSELNRIEAIVGEFLMLSKPHEVQFEEQNIEPMLQMIVSLMSIQAKKHRIHIHLHIEDHVPPIRCDGNQLKQVFMNLIQNAIESMQSGGAITILAEKLDQDNVRIRFIDQGTGIPESITARLGEPFFTTKEQGTGLGLMISHKIIEDHGGTMSFESEVNKGTTVTIVLPVYQQK